MSTTDMRLVLTEELRRIAPEIAPEDIDPNADLRDEFDIDSMDFLTLVTRLGKRLNLDMPEADYDRMRSFDATVAYLQEKTRAA